MMSNSGPVFKAHPIRGGVMGKCHGFSQEELHPCGHQLLRRPFLSQTKQLHLVVGNRPQWLATYFLLSTWKPGAVF